EIRRLGYQGTQLGTGFPAGGALALELRKRDLRLTEVYAAVPIGADGPLPHAAAAVRGGLAVLHEAQGEVLIVALERTPDRDRCIGRALGAPALTPAGWQALGGLLDLPGVLGALAAIGYDGWLMVEQDTSWEPPSEAAAISRHVLNASLRWLAGSKGS